MPKVVDHVRRRAEIVEATWRLIAERGLEGTTMREIAAALGVTHGALTRYFPGKNEIVQAAFEHVFAATNQRIEQRLGDRRGLDAVRVFCEEVLPLTDTTVLEARVVLPFWSRALTEPDLAEAFDRSMDRWRERLAGLFAEARADGRLGAESADGVLVEQLLALLNGAQALTLLSPGPAGPDAGRRMIEDHLQGLSRAVSRPRDASPQVNGSAVERLTPTNGVTAPLPGRTEHLARGEEPADPEFLSFAETALSTAAERLPETDLAAMRLVMLLHRIANAVVYDLESTVHRPAGWSWSAFRLAFTLWISGPLESRQSAQLTGMSRAAVSSLTNTLVTSGMLERSPDPRDGRGVVLSLTVEGRRVLEETFRAHNEREAEWAGLLDPEALESLNRVLGELAAAAATQPWVRRR